MKIYQVYRNLSTEIKSSFWFIISIFLQKSILLITTPVFARILPMKEFGIISTFFAWYTLLYLFVNFSINRSLMNAFVKYESKEESLSAIMSFGGLLSCFWLLIAIFFKKELSSLLGLPSVLVICLFTLFIGQFAIDCWSTYQRYIKSYKKLLLVTFFNILLISVVGIVSVIFISETAASRIIPYASISLITGLCIYIITLKKNRTIFSKEIWIFSFMFSVPLLPHYISEFILSTSDRIMINNLCGSKDVALYNVAYTVAGIVGLLISALNTSYAPFVYRSIKKSDYLKIRKVSNLVLLSVSLFLTVIMIFSHEIVWLVGGSQYMESASIVIPICIGLFFNFVFQLFARIQEYFEYKLKLVIPSILCAIVNIVLNLIFLPIFGYQVAAYTTAISYMLFCLLHYFFYKNLVNSKLGGVGFYDLKKILIITLSMLGTGIICNFLVNYLVIKYIVLIGVVTFGIVERKRIVIFITKKI